MAIRSLKPFTPASRGTVLVDYSSLWKGKPEKTLLCAKPSKAGRNNAGRITCRHKGAGQKVRYRIIDFVRSSLDDSSKAVVQRVEYDPNRTAFIALIKDVDTGELSYILAPDKIEKGDILMASPSGEVNLGSAMPLSSIPLGTSVHNIEMKPGSGGKLVRSAGTTAKIVARDGDYTLISLPSGEKRLILSACRATIGSVSNPDQKNVKLGKAGRSRWLGKRPSVRGVAMNPVDHPLGGGEGKTSGGRHPVTPWGFPTKGKKTRNRNKPSSRYIKSKRK